MAFSMWSVLRCYKQGTKLVDSSTRMEAGVNTSTVAMGLVEGDENGTQCLRV
jgi:hypothetical protein